MHNENIDDRVSLSIPTTQILWKDRYYMRPQNIKNSSGEVTSQNLSINNNSNETDTLKKNKKNKKNTRAIRTQRNNRNDEDQYVALGTKIMRLIIKIINSCKQKKKS
jgi:hypothetical protein